MFGNIAKFTKGNVSIAMHCNLRPSDAAPVITFFNYDADANLPRFKSDNLSIPVTAIYG